MEDFLNQFSVPNQKQTQIKKNSINRTDKNGSSNAVRQIEDLSPGMLSKSESLSFWEKI